MRLIADRPHVRAPDLAASVGRETAPFKNDVRKLKALGLTISHSPGYELSPRGQPCSTAGGVIRAGYGISSVMLLAAAACSDDDDLAAADDVCSGADRDGVDDTRPLRRRRRPCSRRPRPRFPNDPSGDHEAAAIRHHLAAGCGTLTPGVNETTQTAGGATHPVRVFVPSVYAGSRLPVVIDWHGLGSNGPRQAMYSGYESVAEAEGFIVVHPTGVADVAGGPNSWQLFPDPGRERDDLAFAGALIDELVAKWCADPGRVYSTGMSNGGFFTARLICEMSDRIAAAVSVAGMYHPEGCYPARDVPYMAIHGTEDKVVPYGGGESTLMSRRLHPRCCACTSSR